MTNSQTSTDVVLRGEITFRNGSESLLTEEQLESLKKSSSGANPAFKNYERLLRSKPRLAYAKNFVKPDETVTLWSKQSDLVFPRGLYDKIVAMGIKVDDQTVSVPPSTPFVLNATLRDYQQDAINNVVKKKFGVLEAPTGSGKTIMALALSSTLQQRTLFIVHTKTLLKQTIEEVEKKFGFTPGLINGSKFDIKDFTVATVQTLINRTIPDGTFGLVIFDECHHVPANSFIKAASKLNVKHMYGLSATPTRSDGLTWALYATIGPTLHKVPKEALLKNNSIVRPKVIAIQTPYKPSKKFDPFDVASHLNDVSESKIRNDFVIKYIKDVFSKQPNIKPVILTDRVAHAELLAEELQEFNPILYHAQLPNKIQKEHLELIKESTGAFTIATYGAIGEGFDVPLWDTLFLATPFSSSSRLIQALGRVSRAAPGKTESYVHDFVDVHDEVLFNRYEKRRAAYDELGR